MRQVLFLVLILILFSHCQTERTKVERIMEDGVLHIKNPESPRKGTIALELEKIREIDPYRHEEVGMSLVFSERGETGEVILFDPQKAEAHRFNPEGEYLGNFIRIGQGPGEFQEYHGVHPNFIDGKILVTSSIKMAWFTKEGEYLYALQVPQNLSLEKAQICGFGFATVETRDDMPVYVEYGVKNLPALFNTKNLQ